MSKREMETGDIVRFKLKYVRRGEAPKGRYEIVSLGEKDGEPAAVLKAVPGRRGKRATRAERTEPVRRLALDVEVEERLARELMGPRSPGPTRDGSPACRSGSVASGGSRTYCTCDTCF